MAEPEVIPLATRGYWEDWYRDRVVRNGDPSAVPEDDLFEWLAGSDASDGGALWRAILTLPRSARVLELGCGVSRLSERMWLAGFRRVLALDFTPISVRVMRARADALGAPPDQLRYEVADVLRLDDALVPPGAFDVVIDKGLLDVLLNANDQVRWWRRCGSRGRCGYDDAKSRADARDALRAAARALAPGGVMLALSYEPPSGRSTFFADAACGWRFRKPPMEDGRGNYLYELEKTAEGDGG